MAQGRVRTTGSRAHRYAGDPTHDQPHDDHDGSRARTRTVVRGEHPRGPAPRPGAHRPHREPSLHPLGRNAGNSHESRRTGDPAVLSVATRAGAGPRDRGVRRSRASAARRVQAARRRQADLARDRPRAVLRGGGPGGRVRHERGAAGARRRNLLLRPRRHELRRRRGSHPLLRGRTRAVPRVRRDQARAQSLEPEAEGRRPAELAARRGPGTAADAGRDGRHGGAALDGRRSDPPALRAALAASDARRNSRGRRRPDARPSADPPARSALRHRSVRARRRAGGRVRRPVFGDAAGRHGRGLHAAGGVAPFRDRRAAVRVGRDPGRGRRRGSGARAQGAHGAGRTNPDVRLSGVDEHHTADLRSRGHRHRQSREPRVRHAGVPGARRRSDDHVHAARDHHARRCAVHHRADRRGDDGPARPARRLHVAGPRLHGDRARVGTGRHRLPRRSSCPRAVRGRRQQRDGRSGRQRRGRDGAEGGASVRIDRGRPDHSRRGRRHARGSVLGRGAGVPRQPDRDSERRQRDAGDQRSRQPHRFGRSHQRAESRHVHPAVHPGGGAQAAGRTRLSREGAGADRPARGDRAPAGGARGEQPGQRRPDHHRRATRGARRVPPGAGTDRQGASRGAAAASGRHRGAGVMAQVREHRTGAGSDRAHGAGGGLAQLRRRRATVAAPA